MSSESVPRRIRNYRLMFRMALGGLVIGGVATLAGVISLFFQPATTLLLTGVLLVSMSALNGYKLVTSTMRLMDAEGYDLGHYGAE